MSGYSSIPALADEDEYKHTSGKPKKGTAESSAMGYPVHPPGAPYAPFGVPQGVSPSSPLGVWLEPDLIGCLNDVNGCCYVACCLPCAFASNNVRASPMWESLPPGVRNDMSVPINGLYCKAFWLLCLPTLANSWLSALLTPGATQGLLSLLACGAQAYVGAEFRSRLRQKYQLPERALGIDGCPDLAVYLFCTPCAVCQEARELKRRGL